MKTVMKSQRKTEMLPLGETMLTLTSDYADFNYSHTRVEIGDDTLCWISNSKTDEFTKKLRNLIEEYGL